MPRPGRGKATNQEGLSDRHLAVVDEYERLNFSSQKQAMLNCGYAYTTADAITVFLREDVQEEIEKRREKRRKKLEASEDMLMARLRWLIQSNPGEIIQKLRENDYDLAVLSEEEKYVITEITEIETITGNRTTTRYKVKLESSLNAIDKMLRKLGLYKDKVEVTAPGMSLAELLEQGRARMAPQKTEGNDAEVSGGYQRNGGE